MNQLTDGVAQVLRRAFGRPEPTTPCLGCGDQTIEVREFSVAPGPPPGRMDGDVVPRLSPDARFAVVDGQAVVLHDRIRCQSHVLNSSAALIWAEVDDQRTVSQLVDDLVESTGADRGLVDHDVRATLARLLEMQVIEIAHERDLRTEEGDNPGAADPEAVIDRLKHAPPDLDELTRRVMEDTSGHLLLKADAVERDGRVVAVAGEGGQAKSTLTAALVQRGFRHLTDEVACIEPGSLTVGPFAKAIDLDDQALELLGLLPEQPRLRVPPGTSPVPVATLGEVSAGGRLALVVTLFDVDPLDTASTPQSASIRSMIELVSCTCRPSFDDPAVLEWLAEIVATVPLLRLPRGSLDVACAQIEAALDARA